MQEGEKNWAMQVLSEYLYWFIYTIWKKNREVSAF